MMLFADKREDSEEPGVRWARNVRSGFNLIHRLIPQDLVGFLLSADFDIPLIRVIAPCFIGTRRHVDGVLGDMCLHTI